MQYAHGSGYSPCNDWLESSPSFHSFGSPLSPLQFTESPQTLSHAEYPSITTQQSLGNSPVGHSLSSSPQSLSISRSQLFVNSHSHNNGPFGSFAASSSVCIGSVSTHQYTSGPTTQSPVNSHSELTSTTANVPVFSTPTINTADVPVSSTPTRRVNAISR